MKAYSVLLLYPDYLAENYGEDTYLAWVEAENPAKAKRAGQVQAMRAQGGVDGLKADDFLVLLVCEGYVKDLK